MYASYTFSLVPLVDVIASPVRRGRRAVTSYAKSVRHVTLRLNSCLVSLLLLTSVCCPSASAAKVLVYPFAHCLNSHLLVAEKVATLLADRGHDVTMLVSTDYQRLDHIVHAHAPARDDDVIRVTSKPSTSSPFASTNWKHLQLLTFAAPQNYTPICSFDSVDFMLYSPLQTRFNACVQTFLQYCAQIVQNSKLMRRLKAEKYDVLIVEALDPCSRVLADYIDVPFIPLVTTGLGHFDSNPRPPSYLPAVISPFTPRMNFAQRLANLLMKVMYETVPIVMGFDPPFERLKQEHGLNTSLSIGNTFKRASLKLVNSNFAIEYPAPVEPDTILIGGFAIKQARPLVGELRSFVEGAEHGVIVMSFGTLVATFTERWAPIFAQAFSRLPQRVVWRFKDSANAVQQYKFSDNIMLAPWLPQADLLAHRNTKLFITHCGLNGMFEAAHFGVPVVAVPLSADQFNQASKMVDYIGMGLQVDIETLTAEKLFEVISLTLNDSQYRDNARQVSLRFQD